MIRSGIEIGDRPMALALTSTETITIPRDLLKFIMNDVAMVNLSLRNPDSKHLQLTDELRIQALSAVILEIDEALLNDRT
jgi:hypothetical protein